MVLDLLKESSDDAFYTEGHIAFLASKFRSMLIERKYRLTRNSSFESMSSQNSQQVCLNLEQTDLLPDGCSGLWLRSIEELPDTLVESGTNIYPVSDMLFSNVTMIPAERMPYVGYNKWLKNIIYASIGKDNHLYLTSNNNQFVFLEKVKMNAVFADAVEAAKLSCDESSDGCDYLDAQFPLEDSLIPSCIELVIQEIAGPRYNPEDKANNASDDLSDLSLTSRQVATPAERMERATQKQEAAQA